MAKRRYKSKVVGISIEDGTMVEFDSIKEAAQTLYIAHGNICAALRGRIRSSGGYQWKYADDPVDFGEALRRLKIGRRMKRQGWNGKDQYIELATAISYTTPDGEVVNTEHEAIGNKAIAFHGTSGVQMGWLASQADMLAEDWIEA